MSFHANLIDADDLHRLGVVSTSDPGAIGPYRIWIDTGVDGAPATPVYKQRNAADAGWITIASAGTVLDPEVLALASVTGAADKLFYFNGSVTGAVTDFTAAARTVLDDTTTGAMLTTLGAQPLDADLTALAALTRTRGDLIVGGASDWIRLPKGTAGQRLRMADANDPGWTDDDAGFPYVIDGAGAVITTGEKAGFIRAPFTGLITGWTLLGDGTSGSIVVDSWKDTLANFPPTIADTIWSGTEPEISSDTDASATGLSIAVTKGDIIRHSVISVTGFVEATLNYHMTKS